MKKSHLIVIAVLIVGFLGFEGIIAYKASLKPIDASAIWLHPRLNLVHPNDVRGVYMTAAVAEGKWLGGKNKREKIMDLVHETEINGIVIDVKESEGSQVSDGLNEFLKSLQQEAVWKIARVTTFTDNSQVAEHPEWYLKWGGGGIWRDSRGNAWLDPGVPEARQYIIDFSKTIIDLGFDELQFDYIRYPSDGNISAIARTQTDKTKRELIQVVFKEFSEQIRAYDPTIFLSVDLFGYVTQRPEDSIGQALEDAVPYMDYISPMVYPSHYYSGFAVDADEARGLPKVYLSAYGAHVDPETVIHRSMLTAWDTIRMTTSTTGRRAKLRPWLQNFSMGGVWYGKDRIRAQIDAAHKAGTQGYLLWNASNKYTEGALNAN